MNFKVTFRWYDTDTFCTNICVADSENAVKEHYSKKYKDVTVRTASDYEVADAKRRGMPITTVKE